MKKVIGGGIIKDAQPVSAFGNKCTAVSGVRLGQRPVATPISLQEGPYTRSTNHAGVEVPCPITH
jgi:hypothetical protein